MSASDRFVRRNTVDEPKAAFIALPGGVIAALSGAAPTGSAIVDFVIVTVAVAAVVWAAASAPWWAAAGAAGIAAAIAVDPIVAVIGALGFAGGLYIGVQRKDNSELRALAAAVAMNCLIRSEVAGFLGLSAIVGISIGVILLVAGIRRRPAAVRRIGWISIGSVAALVVLAVAGVALVGNAARPDLSSATSQANQAITTLNSGDYATAAIQFESAAAAFGRVDNRLGGVLALPSRLVPGLAQNVNAGVELSSAAADGLGRAAAALRSVDPASLRVLDGAIDVDAIRAVEAPLADVQQVLDELRVASADARSPWLVAQLQDELAELDERIDKNEPRLANAVDAVRLAPNLLGADGVRRYLVLFTSPVEARGLAGFIGNYAIVTIDNGTIDVGEFGRRSDLQRVANQGDARCTGCPPEVMDRYASAGFDIGAGQFGNTGWAAMTMPSHFPYVGEITQIMYLQSGGQPIDGVISMDPWVVQALMQYTGPIDVADIGVTVQPEAAAQFLLEGQYLLLEDGTNDERIEAIDTLGQQVIDSLLAGSLPEPSELANALSPLVAEQRLLVWTDQPDEQALLSRVGLLGELPALGDDGGFSVVVSNQGWNKVDAFLDRTVVVDVVTNDDGDRRLVADVTLTNNAPAEGLPRYVIGNPFGFPNGTSYLWVSFFGPDGTPTVTRNGEPVEVSEPKPEAGWSAVALDDAIAPGGSVTYRVEYDLGAATDAIDEPITWLQPLARRDP